jgi:hypothetical protein
MARFERHCSLECEINDHFSLNSFSPSATGRFAPFVLLSQTGQAVPFVGRDGFCAQKRNIVGPPIVEELTQ